MPGRLRTHVHVTDEHGQSHVFTPHDQIPDWAATRITNPKAWAEGENPHQHDGAEDASEKVPQDLGDGARPSGRPAATATKDVWCAYAAVLGIEVPAGATKADVMAAVDQAEAEQQ